MNGILLLLAFCVFCFWLGFKTAIFGIRALIRRGELARTSKYEGGWGL